MRRPIAIALGVCITVAIAVGVALAGRIREPDSAATVLAAASLVDVVPKVAPDVRASFGGSNQLAQQARLGFPFDVFLSASPVYARTLYAEGVARKPVPFATNRLVVIVPRGNPARIAEVADLARRPKMRLVVAGPKVPIGLYTREVLERLGMLPILRRTVSIESDVKGIVTKVALGEADAGLVYATDAAPVAGKVRVVSIPRHVQPAVVYQAAIAAKPRDLAAARAFVRALLGAEGRKALRAAGFGVPA